MTHFAAVFIALLPDRVTTIRRGQTQDAFGNVIEDAGINPLSNVRCRLDEFAGRFLVSERGAAEAEGHILFLEGNPDIEVGDLCEITRSDGSIVDRLRVRDVPVLESWDVGHVEVRLEKVGR